MNAINSALRCGACVLATLALSLGGVRLQADPSPKQLDAFPLFESYIKVTGQTANVTGDPAAYARRFQKPQDGSYGIEALHLARDLDKETAMEIDGRALSGAEDYLAKVKFTKNEVGSFETGYKRFRTFYNGIGGFFPLNNSFRQLSPAELHTDRAKFWANMKIARPNQPSFELNYSNELRSGRKDTTIWGDTDLTGIPVSTVSSQNLFSANRKIVPSFIDLNERQKVLTAVMKHSAGNTEFEVAVTNNRTNFLDTRFINRFPGELKSFPAIPTNPASIIPPNLVSNPNRGFDAQGSKANVMNYTGKFETKVGDKVTMFGGLSYQRATADISGDRQITLFVNTGAGVVGAVGGFGTFSTRPPYSYTTVTGNTKQNIFAGNLGVKLEPRKDLLLSLAVKGENADTDGTNLVNYLNNLIVQSTGAVTPVIVAAPNFSVRNERSWIPEFTFRYTGVKNLALYGAFDYRATPGKQEGTSNGVTVNAAPSVATMFDTIKLRQGNYKVGANWTVNPALTVRGEFFYKDHTNRYPDQEVPTDGFGFGYRFSGTKLTAIVKPDARITFTTRYIQQSGKMNTVVDSASSYDSGDSKNRTFGETIDWNPTNQVYVQANLNVVFATISTAYPRAGLTANDVLRNADNNYVNGSLITGFTVDKNTDAQLQYTYYRADNFNPATIVSQFYGASTKEYTVALTLKHKFTNRLVGSLKVGYFDSKNGTTGGFTNFRGPMGYLSIEHAL